MPHKTQAGSFFLQPTAERGRNPLMARLLALFILVPIAEFFLLLEIGKRIGLLPTLALIVATGALGAYLARRQGLGVIQQLRNRQAGDIGLGIVIDGVIILLAGAVLITPGILTDAFGFFCLLPAGRRLIKRSLERRFAASIERGDSFLKIDFAPSVAGGKEPMRDVTPRDQS